MTLDRRACPLNAVRVLSSQVREPKPLRNQPSFHSSSEKVSNENCYDYTLGHDGTTHSLPDNPECVFGSPKCFATFYTSLTFAADIQTHYRQESKEGRRRTAAKCRRRNLCLVRSRHALTAVPASSKGKAKGYAARRKNEIAAKVENVEDVRGGLGPGAAMKGPLHGINQ